MKKSLIALALVSAFAAPAFAEEASPLSFNVGAVSDYVFRGISQTQGKPALQAGVDYAHASGLYVGAWGSTVNWVDRSDYTYKKDNDFEVDLYGGYKGAVGDFSYDVGMIRYFYPGKFASTPSGGLNAVGPDTTEAYVSVGWKFVTLKYNQALTSFIGWGDTTSATTSKGSGYTDLTVTYPVDPTLNVIAHVGRQTVKNNTLLGSYTDYKLGVTKDVGFGVVGLAYTDTSGKAEVRNGDYNWSGKNVAKGVVALSFLKTF